MANKGKKGGLQFKTRATEQKIRSRKGFFIFAAVVLLVALASVIVVLSNRQDTEADGQTGNTTNMKDEATVLLANADSDGVLTYLGWFVMDTKNNTIEVSAIDPTPYQETYKGEEADETSCLALTEAVANEYNLDMEKYLIINEDSIARLTNNLGAYSITLDEAVSYRGERFNLNLPAGKMSLGGSQLFNYVAYLGLGYNSVSLDAQVEVVTGCMTQWLTEDNMNDAQSIFETLSNYITTNISVRDFARYQNYLQALPQHQNVVSADQTEVLS